jgi:hypothetical protein
LTDISQVHIENFLANGFAYIPSAVPQDMLDVVDLQNVMFISYDGLNGKVMQTGWFAEMAIDEVPAGLSDISESLQVGIRAAARSSGDPAADHLAHISFNEVTIQLYRPGRGGTGAHRDQARYGFAFAVLTFGGIGAFCIHADDTPDSERQTWIPSAGDVFLMRPGVDGTIHSIPSPESERITISFRHNSLGPKGGGGGTRDLREAGGLLGSQIGLSAPSARLAGAYLSAM